MAKFILLVVNIGIVGTLAYFVWDQTDQLAEKEGKLQGLSSEIREVYALLSEANLRIETLVKKESPGKLDNNSQQEKEGDSVAHLQEIVGQLKIEIRRVVAREKEQLALATNDKNRLIKTNQELIKKVEQARVPEFKALPVDNTNSSGQSLMEKDDNVDVLFARLLTACQADVKPCIQVFKAIDQGCQNGESSCKNFFQLAQKICQVTKFEKKCTHSLRRFYENYQALPAYQKKQP